METGYWVVTEVSQGRGAVSVRVRVPTPAVFHETVTILVPAPPVMVPPVMDQL